MKKSLIALAVAGVFTVPASAATSNVDVYGVLNAAVSLLDDQVDTAEDMQVSTFGSRIGFKGSEDLGGGLKGIWQIESSINFDEQNGTLSGRNSFVGLSGGFGTALIGNHDTPLKLVGRKVDLFGDTMADSRNVVGGGSDARAQNVIAYITPSFSGFSLAAAWTNDLNGTPTLAGTKTYTDSNGDTVTIDTSKANTSAGDDTENSAWNVNATYENGPLFVGFAYGDGDYHDTNLLEEHWRVAGAYSFGDLKIVGQYDSLGADDNNPNQGDYDAWMVGVAYTMGAITLKGNYMDGEFDDNDVVSSKDVSQWTVGADYALSKRTRVYALYADGENVTLGKGAGASDQIAPANEDISVFSLGVVHSF